eukprot:1071345-Prymnesium_polylepis.1
MPWAAAVVQGHAVPGDHHWPCADISEWDQGQFHGVRDGPRQTDHAREAGRGEAAPGRLRRGGWLWGAVGRLWGGCGEAPGLKGG